MVQIITEMEFLISLKLLLLWIFVMESQVQQAKMVLMETTVQMVLVDSMVQMELMAKMETMVLTEALHRIPC